MVCGGGKGRRTARPVVCERPVGLVVGATTALLHYRVQLPIRSFGFVGVATTKASALFRMPMNPNSVLAQDRAAHSWELAHRLVRWPYKPVSRVRLPGSRAVVPHHVKQGGFAVIPKVCLAVSLPVAKKPGARARSRTARSRDTRRNETNPPPVGPEHQSSEKPKATVWHVVSRTRLWGYGASRGIRAYG